MDHRTHATLKHNMLRVADVMLVSCELSLLQCARRAHTPSSGFARTQTLTRQLYIIGVTDCRSPLLPFTSIFAKTGPLKPFPSANFLIAGLSAGSCFPNCKRTETTAARTEDTPAVVAIACGQA